MAGLVATAETQIDAAPETVWHALTDPEAIRQYMFGTAVETDWQPGSRIVWRGEFQGRRYEDRGEILAAEPGRRLEVTHFSPLTGQDDVPENYHRIAYTLEPTAGGTRLSLSQDNNATDEDVEHARANWQQVLAGIARVAEGGGPEHHG